MKRPSSRPLAPQELIKALDQAKALLSQPPVEQVDKEQLSKIDRIMSDLENERRDSRAILLAVLGDNPVPVKFFSLWISYSKLRTHELSGDIKLERRMGRVLLRPSEFFRFYASLPAEQPRTAGNAS